jgi:hypothetical protein
MAMVYQWSQGCHGTLGGSGCLPAVTDALTAEGEACLVALLAVMESGISHIIIETNSTNMVSSPK